MLLSEEKNAWTNGTQGKRFGIVLLHLFTFAFSAANAATVVWDGGAGAGGTSWLTPANWAGDILPGTTDIAQFAVAGTSTPIGINMNGATNNGANNEAVGAIELLSTRNRTIGNSSTVSAGTLTLNGVTVNSVANVILRNASDKTLTLQDNTGGGTQAMDVALGNATNNVINIDGTGDINISTVIKNGAANANLTLGGAGSGILTFSGAGANTYSGLTTVNATELDLNKTAGVDAIAGNLQVGGTGTVKLLASNQIKDSASLTVNTGGIFNLNANNETIGALNGNGGTITNSPGSTNTGSTLTVGSGDASGSYAGTVTETGTGFRTLSLVKTGAGTQVLTGSNTYSGGTIVNGGSFFANNTTGSATGTAANATVVVNNSGTTLGGSGRMSGPVSMGGRTNLAPGATGSGSTAILNIGSLTMSSANFLVDLNAGGLAGTNYDQLKVTGSVILGSTSMLQVMAGAGLMIGDKFFILLNDQSDLVSGSFSNAPLTGSTFTADGYTFQINYLDNGDLSGVSNDISLTVLTAVPEPGTWMVGALTLAGICYSQRKRLRAFRETERKDLVVMNCLS